MRDRCKFGIDSVMRYYDKEEGGKFKGAFVLSQRCECEKVVDEKSKKLGFILRDPLMCVRVRLCLVVLGGGGTGMLGD